VRTFVEGGARAAILDRRSRTGEKLAQEPAARTHLTPPT